MFQFALSTNSSVTVRDASPSRENATASKNVWTEQTNRIVRGHPVRRSFLVPNYYFRFTVQSLFVRFENKPFDEHFIRVANACVIVILNYYISVKQIDVMSLSVGFQIVFNRLNACVFEFSIRKDFFKKNHDT